MTAKVLKDRHSNPVLIVPKGISVRSVSSFEDEMFFVLAEASSGKSAQEIELAKKVKMSYARLYHSSTNFFGRRKSKKDREITKDLRFEYEHTLIILQLEQEKRLLEDSRLYLGTYGDLEAAEIYSFPTIGADFYSLDYHLNDIRGKIVLSPNPDGKHEGVSTSGQRMVALSPQPESQHGDFAIHNRKRLGLTRLL